MSCIGPGKMVGLRIEGRADRKWMDLDCEDDWGDLDCGVGEDGKSWVSVGNDEDGYAKVIDAVEDAEGEERPLTLGMLREMIESRTAAYSS